jgi:allantoin racemase
MNKIAFLNPNSTIAMTESCAESFANNLPDGFDVDGLTNRGAPPAIQGAEDGAAAVPGVLKIISDNPYDAYVIACFDDTGLIEARKITKRPVIGIGQASFHYAALAAGGFSVLTTLPVSVPVITENIKKQGFSGICDGVYASGVPVLDLEHKADEARRIIASHITKITEKSPDTAVVLGCAGMTNIWGRLQSEFKTPLVDPVAAAARLIPAFLDR